jgi:hypothetical protein
MEEDLPTGWLKVEGYHGFGRDIYVAKHENELSASFQIFSKAVGEKTWFPGKVYFGRDRCFEEFHTLIEALMDSGYAPKPLHVMEQLPDYGRFG